MEELVKKAMKGDGNAFVELVGMNRQILYKTAWSYLRNDADIADAIQETMLKCFENIKTLKKPKYFRTWMIRILINNCMDILGKKTPAEQEIPLETGEEESGFEQCEWKQLLSSLDPTSAEIMQLYYYEGLSTKQISGLLGIKRSTVLTKLDRARKNIRQALER